MAEAEKKQKVGFFARISKFLREMRSELKKVVWPDKSQMINNTVVVIVTIIVVGIFIWVFDAVANLVVQGLIGLFT